MTTSANPTPDELSKSYGRLVAWLFGGATILTVLGGVLLLGRACNSIAVVCGDEVVSRTPSPNRQMNAVVFVRNCGATTGYSTHVVLARNDQTTTAEKESVLVAKGSNVDLRIRWIDDAVVLILHHANANIAHFAATQAGIEIRCEAFHE